jgi:Na+/melibiose symporter-like transporter
MMKPVRHGIGVPEAASGVGRQARQIWRPGAVVSLRERLSYGLGDFASGLYWQTFTLYLTFFYTDVFGLSALAAGTLLGMSRSLDALFDPVLGAVADRTRTRWGSFRPYLLWLSAPLALAGVLAFTVPDLAADDKNAEWKTERRSTGLVFATVLLASKQGWAIGAVVSLGLLSNVGFVANAEQTPETLHGLLLLVSVVPAAIGAVALVLMLFYPLDDARLSRIGAELSARRAVESRGETA